MQISLHLVLISCHVFAFSASMPIPDRTGATESCAQSYSSPSRSHQQYRSLSKSKPSWLHGARGGRLRGVSQECKKSHSSTHPVNVSRDRRHTTSRVARLRHKLKLVSKSGGRKKLHLAVPEVPQQKNMVMTRFNFRHNRRMEKRSPVDSSLSSLLGSLSSPLSSLPVVGVPLTSLFSTLPTSSVTSPGLTIAGLLGTLTQVAQSAPVLGDLLKLLPLSAVLKGNPIENLKSTLSGLFVAVPLVGGTLGGLPNAVSGVASALPFSLADMRVVTPITTQRTTAHPPDSKPDSRDTPDFEDGLVEQQPPKFLDRTTRLPNNDVTKANDNPP